MMIIQKLSLGMRSKMIRYLITGFIHQYDDHYHHPLRWWEGITCRSGGGHQVWRGLSSVNSFFPSWQPFFYYFLSSPLFAFVSWVTKSLFSLWRKSASGSFECLKADCSEEREWEILADDDHLLMTDGSCDPRSGRTTLRVFHVWHQFFTMESASD